MNSSVVVPSRWLVAILILMLVSASPAQVKRAFSADDLFRLEELGQTSLSPDGRWLAFVLRRPKSVSLIHARPFLEGDDRGDVWLVSTAGGKSRNLTNGKSDGSGWWAPTWSPDSERLALLSTRGGNVRLWVWEKATARLKRLTEDGVDIMIAQSPPFVWLTDHQLACAILPKGQKPNPMTLEMRASEVAMSEWPKAWRGLASTVNVLESGIRQELNQRPQSKLLLIDVMKDSRQLASAFTFRELKPSPDRQNIAVLKQTEVVRPDPDKLLIHGRVPAIYRAVVLNRDGHEWLGEFSEINDVQPGSLRWSPDGRSLALVRKTAAGLQAVACSLTSGKCESLSTVENSVSLAWSGKGRLLILTRTNPTQLAWWAFDEGGRKRNLTASLKVVPRELLLEASGESLIGIADGELWRVNADGSASTNLTSQLEPRVNSIVWPRPGDDERQSVTQVILSVTRGTRQEWLHIDLNSSKSTWLTRSNAAAMIAGYEPQRQMGVLTSRDHSGSYLWLAASPFNQLTTVVETNTYLREIVQGEFESIQYKSADGQELKGWVLLPIGYEPGKRYPLITVVYGGMVFGDNPPGMARSINSTSSLNYQLLAARGYAVLFPSMPLKPQGQPSDPHLELTKGVLPAVDTVIEQGLADPKRLGLLGQSYGGYCVYGLIAQTSRFQAAVSLAGLSDLVSLYGTIDTRFRYDQFAHERLLSMSMAETGSIRWGILPGKISNATFVTVP